MSDFHDVLADFKANENHEDALVLLMDRHLLLVAGLWRASLLTRAHSYVFDSDWNALWDCVEIDFKRLADLADEQENRIRLQVDRLRELKLIYPDGTRTQMATKAVTKFLFDGLT